MRENYKTIYAGGEGEITEKKSRLIAMLILLENIGSLLGAVMTGSRQELQDGLCWM